MLDEKFISRATTSLTMTSVNGSSYTDVPVDHNETWRCKAAVLTAYNTPLEIKEIEVGPLRDGECLVQIVAGGLADCRRVVYNPDSVCSSSTGWLLLLGSRTAAGICHSGGHRGPRPASRPLPTTNPLNPTIY